jgi:hypothetical protein
MLLRPFLFEETSRASYLFGCLTHSQLAVVGPHIDFVEDYLDAAEAIGTPIVAVFERGPHSELRSCSASARRSSTRHSSRLSPMLCSREIVHRLSASIASGATSASHLALCSRASWQTPLGLERRLPSSPS